MVYHDQPQEEILRRWLFVQVFLKNNPQKINTVTPRLEFRWHLPVLHRCLLIHQLQTPLHHGCHSAFAGCLAALGVAAMAPSTSYWSKQKRESLLQQARCVLQWNLCQVCHCLSALQKARGGSTEIRTASLHLFTALSLWDKAAAHYSSCTRHSSPPQQQMVNKSMPHSKQRVKKQPGDRK